MPLFLKNLNKIALNAPNIQNKNWRKKLEMSLDDIYFILKVANVRRIKTRYPKIANVQRRKTFDYELEDNKRIVYIKKQTPALDGLKFIYEKKLVGTLPNVLLRILLLHLVNEVSQN